MWISAAVTVAAVLLGIRMYDNHKPLPTRDNPQIVSFSYYHSGSSTYEIYSYEVEMDEETESMMVLYELNCGHETYTLPADGELLQELSDFIDAHNLWKWDGFDKIDSRVMDGSGFGLEICFADGTGISASGSNRFPDGYSEAMEAMDRLFIGYLEKNGIVIGEES